MLLFHAELDGPVNGPGKGDPTDYDTFLKSRPESFETGKPSPGIYSRHAHHVDMEKIALSGVARASKN